jgi:hypothetical protein
MKNILLYILLFLLTASSCKEEPKLEPDKWALPPLTSEGANTLGCLIDGEPFVADYEVIPWGGDVSISAEFQELKYVGCRAEDVELDRSSISLRAYYDTDKKHYNLATDSVHLPTQYIDYRSFGGRPYRIIDEEPQWVKVYSFKENEYVAGTFQFTGVSSEGDTVRIINGRFDIALD